MSKAETLRNIRVLLVIHLGGEHIIRPRINFEVAVERLIYYQRFAGFRVRYNREEGKEKEHTRNQVCSILMVNAKTFRTMKKVCIFALWWT